MAARYRKAGARDQLSPLTYAALPGPAQDAILSDQSDDAVQELVGTALGHTIEAMYGPPEYGGNHDLAGWTPIGWQGDVQPRGYTARQVSELEPSGQFEVAYCNSVFHHVEPEQRLDALGYVHRSLSEGGHFAFWENNPWNPGTCLVMRRIPFDRDAKRLSPPHARRLLSRAGFDVLRTDFLFFFPRVTPFLSAPPLCLRRSSRRASPFRARSTARCRPVRRR